MNKIIVYASQYGTTKRYAEELAKKTNFPIYSYKEFLSLTPFDGEIYDTIIYLGAIYAGGILKMSKILNSIDECKHKNVFLITVGLFDPKDEQVKQNIKNNILNQLEDDKFKSVKIRHLRGGIDYSKLKLKHKMLMKILYHSIKKLPKEKLTAEYKVIIETYKKTISFVVFSTLDAIIDEIQMIK